MYSTSGNLGHTLLISLQSLDGDVWLSAADGSWKMSAHGTVLRLRSSFFEGRLQAHWGNEPIMLPDNVTKAMVDICLWEIYIGSGASNVDVVFGFSMEEILALVSLANEWMLFGLIEKLKPWLEKKMDVDNALSVLSSSVVLGVESLSVVREKARNLLSAEVQKRMKTINGAVEVFTCLKPKRSESLPMKRKRSDVDFLEQVAAYSDLELLAELDAFFENELELEYHDSM